MPALNESALTILASVTAGVQNGDSATTIYAVPAGKTLYIWGFVVRDPTDSLASGTDYDFGSYKTTVDLSGMTTSGTDYYIVQNHNSVLSEVAASATVQLTVNTGATADADATVDLIGFLV